RANGLDARRGGRRSHAAAHGRGRSPPQALDPHARFAFRSLTRLAVVSRAVLRCSTRMESTAKSDRARTVWTFVAIALFAFTVRFVYLLQARACPMFDGLVVDGLAYWSWSDKIAGGDWLGEGVFYQAPLYPYFLAV